MYFMSNVIFYFTGTGNSLVVARDIADKVEDTSIISIASVKDEILNDLQYDRIGFVFPVYFWSVPSIVKRFVKKLSFNKKQYIFGVVTYAGSSGMALSELDQCIREQGGMLKAGFSVRLPGNYICRYGAFASIIQQMLFKGEKKRVISISSTVKDRNSTRIPNGGILSRIAEGSIKKAIDGFGTSARNFYVASHCNGCGSCQRVCPVSNIKIVDGHPEWGNECECCMACIQWCPTRAIEYADKTAKRKRYHHPEVKISDLMGCGVTESEG